MAKKKQLGTQVGGDQGTSPQASGSGTSPAGEQKSAPKQDNNKQQNAPQAPSGPSEQDALAAFAQRNGDDPAASAQRGDEDAVQAFAALQNGREQVKGMTPPQAPKDLPPLVTTNEEDAPMEDALDAQKPITVDSIREAMQILERYKAGKINMDEQRIRNEEWFRLRHWELLRQKQGELEPVSGWLFNAVAAKHADFMDNYPTCNILPRAQDDEQTAAILSEIIPAVLERNDFEEQYSRASWDKLKNGLTAYGVFWDSELEDGLGDIIVKQIDPLKIFWQPGITDLQRSRNLFVIDFVHRDELHEAYAADHPELDVHTLNNVRDFRQYVQDDYSDNTDMIPVIDWYYKKLVNGKQVLHYCKFVDEVILFATENEAGYDNGLYEHGEYPIHLDVLYPEAGTLGGFGIISIAKDNQLYIDQLYADILSNCEHTSKPRWLFREGAGVNKEQFLDPNNPIVDVQGSLEERYARPIDVPSMPSYVMNMLTQKIDELKETTSNRDVNTGTTASGVTAASAISALQEAGNKNSRDLIEGGYRTFQNICRQVMELIRQFYQDERCFRISGKGGQPQYIPFSNAQMQAQPLPEAFPGQNAEEGIVSKRPVYDIKISAEKKSPYQRLSQNTFIMELYGAGFFQPENAQASLAALDAMEFEGKDEVVSKVQEGQTLLNIIQQMQMQMQMMQQQMAMLTGQPMPGQEPPPQEQQQDDGEKDSGAGNTEGGRALRAQRANRSAQTDTKHERIRKNASADMNRGGGGTARR